MEDNLENKDENLEDNDKGQNVEEDVRTESEIDGEIMENDSHFRDAQKSDRFLDTENSSEFSRAEKESSFSSIREETDENIAEVENRAEEVEEDLKEQSSEVEEQSLESQENSNDKENKEDKEEKLEENKEEKSEDKKPDDKPVDQIKDKKSHKKTWAIIGIVVIAVILIVILFALIYNPDKTNKFKYDGFSFEKIQFGGIYLYETNLTILENGRPFNLNVRLRNDPRVLDKIPVNYSGLPSLVYFAFPEKTLNCSSDSLIAAFQVGQYLGNLKFNVIPAVTENFTGNTLPVVDCSKASKSKGVVILKPFSEQDRISQGDNGCVILEAKNCSVIEVSERFVLSLLGKIRDGEIKVISNNQGNKNNSS